MSVTGAPRSPDGSTYIRAGGGTQVSGRRVAGVLVWLTVAALLGTAAYLVASAASYDSRMTLLRDRGVAVQATVTGCTAISSGVGMGIEYWDCRGTYTLGGHGFTATLGGNRKLIDSGTTVRAVAVPGHPDVLATAASVRAAHGPGAQYGAAAALAAAGLLVGGARISALRRHRPA